MRASIPLPYRLSRWVLRVAMGSYFARIERFHRELRRFTASLRCASVLFRAPIAARRLLALRNELIAEIEAARWQVPTEALTQERKG